MRLTYTTFGTCAREIEIALENDRIAEVRFTGGCRGNTQGIAALAVGRDVEEIRTGLRGIECRNGTSCPDQLARALEELSARLAS